MHVRADGLNYRCVGASSICAKSSCASCGCS